MAQVVRDAGVLIGYEREDAAAREFLAFGVRNRDDFVVAAPTLAEVWRDGARQARLARLSRQLRTIPCDARIARSAGELLARTGTHTTLDAILVATAAHAGAAIVTADAADITPLAEQAKIKVLALNP